MTDQIRRPQSETQNPAIELHIEELLLDGFADLDGAKLGAAVQEALGRLIAERGGPASLAHGGTVAHLDAGAFAVAPGSDAQVIGSQIAQAIYGGLQS